MLNKKQIFSTFVLLFFVFLNFITYISPAKASGLLTPTFTLTSLSAGQSADFYGVFTTVTDIPAGGNVAVVFSDYSYLTGGTHIGSNITYADIDVEVSGSQLTLTGVNTNIYNTSGYARVDVTVPSTISSGNVIKFWIGHNATGGSSNARVTVASNINVIAETLTSGLMVIDQGNADATLALSVPEFTTYIYVITILGGLLMIYKKSNLNYRSNSNIAI